MSSVDCRESSSNGQGGDSPLLKHQYAGVGQHLRDVIIDEYLKEHPEVPRSQVVTRTVNGKAICDTIDNIAAEVTGKRKFQDLRQDQEFVQKQLELSADERHQACLASISASKRVINFLFASKFCEFNLTEKNENLNFLKRYERLSVDRGHAVHEIKKELVTLSKSKTKPAETTIRSQMARYLHAVLDQLKCQAAIYKREFTLGDRFRSHSVQFIDEHLGDVKESIKKSVLEAISSAYTVAKKGNGKSFGAVKSDPEELKAALGEMDICLKKRRGDFRILEKVIAYLEQLVSELEDREKERQQEEAKKAEVKGKGHRMAFASKVLRGFSGAR